MKLRARIEFFEGGRSSAPPSGVRSTLRVGEVDTSVTVHAETAFLALGEERDVVIELQFPEYGKQIDRSKPVELYEGSRMVARGVWLD